MEWHNLRNKRTSVSGVPSYQVYQPHPASQRLPITNPYLTEKEPVLTESRASYFSSQHPLYCVDWATSRNTELVALSSFREGFQNRISVVQGQPTEIQADADDAPAREPHSPERWGSYSERNRMDRAVSPTTAFEFGQMAETLVDYPVTSLQWDPRSPERLAASSDVLRLYKLEHEYQSEATLVQTHLLANNSTAHSGGGSDSYDISTFPPVTSFDWNKTDPSIIITSSVDTTCTVWDLNRSRSLGNNTETAQVKTQLIAHDSEVFDVKFIHMSTNVFASVSNDGSVRVFDLRSLEHSTIIYEPAQITPVESPAAGASYNAQALLKLSTSNVDQHHLATVGVNSNQVLVIDMRMPGVPVSVLDSSFEGASQHAVNSIQWHPSSNLLATGGDDCQALVWDCTKGTEHSQPDNKSVIDTPILAYADELEVNSVCWRASGDWMGVVSGKGFQALQTD